MTGLTLHGVAITSRRPAPPSAEDTLELADHQRRGTLNAVERDSSSSSARSSAATRAATPSWSRSLRDQLEDVLEDAAVQRAMATHNARRVEAGFECLSILITGRSYDEVATGLTAAVREVPPALTGFDLSDCTEVER